MRRWKTCVKKADCRLTKYGVAAFKTKSHWESQEHDEHIQAPGCKARGDPSRSRRLRFRAHSRGLEVRVSKTRGRISFQRGATADVERRNTKDHSRRQSIVAPRRRLDLQRWGRGSAERPGR